MSPTRERLRRAASVVVLLAALGVLVATSKAPETTSESFVFDPAAFDGRTQVVVGSIGARVPVPDHWNRQQVVVRGRTNAIEATMLVEFLDASGRTLGATYVPTRPAGLDVSDRSFTAEIQRPCGVETCDGPVTYRIHQLDGGRLEVGVTVVMSFEAGSDDELPPVPIAATRPIAIEQTEPVRTQVRTVSLRADSEQPVAAVWASWPSSSCEDKSVGVTVIDWTRSGRATDGHGWHILAVDGEVEDNGEPVPFGPTSPLGAACDYPDGRGRQSGWIVLSTEGPAVEVELAVVVPPGHPAVSFRRARVRPQTVERLSGADYYEVAHQPGSSRHDPSPAYLLGIEVPEPVGVAVDYQDLVQDLCSHCRGLSIRVSITATGVTPPEDVNARAVVYEIRVPGS